MTVQLKSNRPVGQGGYLRSDDLAVVTRSLRELDHPDPTPPRPFTEQSPRGQNQLGRILAYQRKEYK